MPSLTRCSSCGRALQVPDELLGRRVQCPSCGTTFTAGAGPIAPVPTPAVTAAPVGKPAPYIPLGVEGEPGARHTGRSEEDDYDEEGEYDLRRRRAAAARAAVQGPALALMLAGVLGLLMWVVVMVAGLSAFQAGAQQAGNRPEGLMVRVLVFVTLLLIFLVWSVIVVVGAVRMKNLQSYGLAMTAAIVAMLPGNYCCVLGLPVGIWALSVLNQPEVKSAFR